MRTAHGRLAISLTLLRLSHFNFITHVGQVRLVPGLFVILVYILSMDALCLPSRNVNGEFVGSSSKIMILLGSKAE